MRWLALPLALLTLAGLAFGLWPRGPVPGAGGLDAAAVATALAEMDVASGVSAGASSGIGSGPVSFPRDHAVHPDARAELWELSAVLRDAAGEPVTVQLSLARLGLRAETTSKGAANLDPQAEAEVEAYAEADEVAKRAAAIALEAETQVPAEDIEDGAVSEGESIGRVAAEASLGSDAQPMEQRTSALAADAVFAGELVVMGARAIDGGAVRAQRVSRAALGLAGAGADKTGIQRVWIEQWALSREVGGSWVLRAEAEGVELELGLSPLKPPVVLGQQALAGSPRQADMASVRFYAESRLVASGRLQVDGIDQTLHGLAWLDHGWGALSEALAGGQGQLVANRFQLQLDDGSELACLHLRRRTGGGTPIPNCVLIGVDGEKLVLRRRDLTLVPIESGLAILGGVEYPLGWQLVIPGRELELGIKPLFDDAASAMMSTSFAGASKTWRGAVQVDGWRGADAIGGSGRMDLNGYADGMPFGT